MIPSILLAYTGNEIILNCISYYVPLWIKNNSVIEAKYIFNKGHTLKIKQSKPEDEGVYECYDFDRNGHKIMSSSTVYVGGKYNSAILKVVTHCLNRK